MFDARRCGDRAVPGRDLKFDRPEIACLYAVAAATWPRSPVVVEFEAIHAAAMPASRGATLSALWALYESEDDDV